MSHTSDHAESDDLIAELARLMAEDAKGSSTTASSTAGKPKPDAGDTDTITRTSGRAPSDRLSVTRKSGSLYGEGEHPAGDSAPAQRAEISNKLAGHLEPTDKAFEADTLGEIHSLTTGRTRPLESQPRATGRGDVTRDPIAELIAAQLEHSSPEPKPERRRPSAEQPSARTGSDRFVAEPHPPEEDQFNEPPVFGVTTAGSNGGNARHSSDPLEEIESLIGDAVRIGNMPGEEAPEPAPSRRARPAEDLNDAAAAAEAAILAATAETGRGGGSAESVSAVDELHEAIARQNAAPEPELDRDQIVDNRRSIGQRLVGPLVAAGLLVAIGGGLYWMFGNGVIDDGEAPVLSADTTPVKEDPTPAVGNTAEPARSIVFDELSGDADVSEPAQLVSRDQTEGVSGEDVARVVGDVARVIAPEEDVATTDGGLANRKVRTVTVLPDGTIVSGDDAVAGGEVLPVDRPNVPELPAGTETLASELADTPIISDTPAADVATTGDNLQALQPVEDALPAETLLDTQATGSDSLVAPIPRPRPVTRPAVGTGVENLITNSVNTPASGASNDEAVDLIASLANQSVASSQPAPLVQTTAVQQAGTTPVTLTESSGAPAYVQLSSRRSEETAQTSLNEIRAKFGSQLTGGPLEIQRVDLGEKGIYFRVRMPASSIDQANSVCSNVKLNGGDCFVRTN